MYLYIRVLVTSPSPSDLLKSYGVIGFGFLGGEKGGKRVFVRKI